MATYKRSPEAQRRNILRSMASDRAKAELSRRYSAEYVELYWKHLRNLGVE